MSSESITPPGSAAEFLSGQDTSPLEPLQSVPMSGGLHAALDDRVSLESDEDLSAPIESDSYEDDDSAPYSAGGENAGEGELTALWERCLADLRAAVDPALFAAYLAPLKLRSFNSVTREATLEAGSRFVGAQVENTFREKISGILAAAAGIIDVEVKIAVAEEGTRQKSPPVVVSSSVLRQLNAQSAKFSAKSDAAATAVSRRNAHQINPKYTFSNFVVGNSNQFGHAAAMRVGEQPGMSYNPLFIYGGVGLGKTHLLHAIANKVLERNPSAHVLYMSSETFTNELIQSLRNEKMNEFKNRLRSVEVLLIDDIQFLCGKERTQEEFFHTFNALYASKHQIVVTSDKLPQEIPGIEERLQTRFSWGLTADLQAPDFETRVAILKRKAALESIELPSEVAHLIAEKISSNVRELEGALTRLHAVSSLKGTPISVDFALSALKPLLLPKTVNISVDDIKKSVADFFNIRLSEMVSKRRTRNLSFPRHIAMYLCRKHTTCSYPEIGEHFGGRDHSSVIHASNVVTTKIAQDPDTRELVGELEKRLIGH